jgi:hypothetical protein
MSVPKISSEIRPANDGTRAFVVAARDVASGSATQVWRQDQALTVPFPRAAGNSQLHSEKVYIHCLRLIGMGIDKPFQDAAEKVCICIASNGDFKGCNIKGFGRMKNKCTSKLDHYAKDFPRPSHNIDINRNACTFETPGMLLSFIENMQAHAAFGQRPVRIKNMFLFSVCYAYTQACCSYYYIYFVS